MFGNLITKYSGQIDKGILQASYASDGESYYWNKYTFNVPALNFTYGSSKTVQPLAIQSLIIIKDWIASGWLVELFEYTFETNWALNAAPSKSYCPPVSPQSTNLA